MHKVGCGRDSNLCGREAIKATRVWVARCVPWQQKKMKKVEAGGALSLYPATFILRHGAHYWRVPCASLSQIILPGWGNSDASPLFCPLDSIALKCCWYVQPFCLCPSTWLKAEPNNTAGLRLLIEMQNKCFAISEATGRVSSSSYPLSAFCGVTLAVGRTNNGPESDGKVEIRVLNVAA